MVFRVDASTIIGAGHVMRGLTPATEIVQRGMTVHFICSSLPGHLINKIHTSGFPEGVTGAIQYGHQVKAHAVYLSQY